jgi:ADP-ribosyl-[dinitrogen reductase] hydrolase
MHADRAAGVLLGTACGDALGAGYEFGPPLPEDVEVTMRGGNGFAPGEWTDDTSMAVAIAQATAAGHDLRTQAGLDAVASAFLRWFRGGPNDVGLQTRAVLRAADSAGGDSVAMSRASAEFLAANPVRGAGNGALMRTAPVALAFLGDDEAGLVDAAQAVSALTHADPASLEACLLWCLAIRRAVLDASFDLRSGLAHLPHDRVGYWEDRIDEAEAGRPSDFDRNGWVVQALQAAWSAIVTTPVPADDPARGSFPAQHLSLALAAAVRGGRDADTVAAIAGGLLGGRWGASAVPSRWRRHIFGWPGYRARDLVRLGLHTARRGLGEEPDDAQGWPGGDRISYSGTRVLVPHPRDPGVLLSTVEALDPPPAGVTAVVSLCRLGVEQVPVTGIVADNHVEVWLIDDSAQHNPNLEYVLDDAARAVAQLRDAGETVLLHCVRAASRTPVVAARYSVVRGGVEPGEALAEVVRALPYTDVHDALATGLERLGSS